MAKKSLKKTTKGAALALEPALKELEALIERMETGDLSLEESLKCFEQGTALTRHCQQALAAAEQKVQILLEADAQTAPKDFSAPDEA